ncbi:ABC transporter ATP-binding protein [Dactylosporangium sp. AC04546]|uniref:ABC transporter ATP-binding protein n=1 Tax=Dactylosporangium sp. AC04546 TaxID=2862460 RepID=UPI001EDE7764|nr:ABC transporter ATP-binding protein [Dactylosporangium sp. AC04546]WVK81145.1 ABC transporter ATP-binding protein [Dactylosporangium sp. AC04546]
MDDTRGTAAMVRARSLYKRYAKRRGGEFTAVDGIEFNLRRGECFGFLGPNGAGKSSTMRMIGCVSTPTSGELEVLGLDVREHGRRIRSRLGVVPQDDALDGELSVTENFLLYGRYFALPRRVIDERTRELLEFAQLTDKADARVDELSGGMRRRLTIARALINQPELVLLDEPTTGLDPQARHVLWERLFRLKRDGVTLILTTHYMDEAEQLCDRLVVMDQGRIVAAGTPRELIDAHCAREVVEVRFDHDDLAPAAKTLGAALAGQRIETLPDRLLVYADDGEATLHTVNRQELRPITSLIRRSSLEDVFLALTGRTLVD